MICLIKNTELTVWNGKFTLSEKKILLCAIMFSGWTQELQEKRTTPSIMTLSKKSSFSYLLTTVIAPGTPKVESTTN